VAEHAVVGGAARVDVARGGEAQQEVLAERGAPHEHALQRAHALGRRHVLRVAERQLAARPLAPRVQRAVLSDQPVCDRGVRGEGEGTAGGARTLAVAAQQ